MNTRSFLLAALLAFASCSKDDISKQPTLTEALTSHSWTLKRKMLYFADGRSLDFTDITFKPCERDDIFSFGKDGVFSKSDGAVVCDPLGASVFNQLNGGGWTVQDSTLVIAAGFNVQEFKVSSWDNSSMIWKQPYVNYFGEKEEYVYELVAQQ